MLSRGKIPAPSKLYSSNSIEDDSSDDDSVDVSGLSQTLKNLTLKRKGALPSSINCSSNLYSSGINDSILSNSTNRSETSDPLHKKWINTVEAATVAEEKSTNSRDEKSSSFSSSEEEKYEYKIYDKTEEARKTISDAISSNVLFHKFSARKLEKFIDAFVPSKFMKGEVIIQEGDEGDQFYVLEKGSIKIERDGTNRTFVKSNPGFSFGETALLCKSLRNATLTALENTTLWYINEQTYREIFVSCKDTEDSFRRKENPLHSISRPGRMLQNNASQIHHVYGNLTHIIPKECSTGKCEKNFTQFCVLSISNENFSDVASSIFSFSSQRQYVSGSVSFKPHAIRVKHQLPTLESQKTMSKKQKSELLDAETLSTFCFPNGLKVRLIPKKFDEASRRNKWFGKGTDQYQLHTFTDSTGQRRHGIAIITSELVTDPELIDLFHCQVSEIMAANLIISWWRQIQVKRQREYTEKREQSSQSYVNYSFLGGSQNTNNERRFLASSLLKYRKRRNSGDVLSKMTKKIMNDANTYFLTVEKCYIMVGLKPEEKSLYFIALQKLVDGLREERLIQSMSNLPNLRASRVGENSNTIQKMEEKLQSMSSSVNELTLELKTEGKTRNIDVHFGTGATVSIRYPFPDIVSVLGFAMLCSKIHVVNLISILKLLVMERSVLLIGTKYEEVTTCTNSLASLLKPYTWENGFMSLLPLEMIDIIEAPIPLIAGFCAPDAKSLKELESNPSVQEAIVHGMSVINLDNGNFTMTKEKESCTLVKKSATSHGGFSIHEFVFFQSKLKRFMDDPNSSLNSFHSFCQTGASQMETKLIWDMRKRIEGILKSFSGIMCDSVDAYKEYEYLNPLTNDVEFNPQRLLEPLKAELQIQEKFLKTQLFNSFLAEKRERSKLLSGPVAKKIALWIEERHERLKELKKKSSVQDSLRSSDRSRESVILR